MRQWYQRFVQLRRHAWLRAVIFVVLFVVLLELVLASLSANQIQTTPIDRELVLQTTFDQVGNSFLIDGINATIGTDWGYESGLDYTDRQTQLYTGLINNSRWPRVIMAVLIGAALALSGNVLQGVFRNPLADPGLIGVSAGAAMGAILAILGGADLTTITTQVLETLDAPDAVQNTFSGQRFAEALAAFVGGLLMTGLVYNLAQLGGQRSFTINMLLIGLAINAIGSAFIGMATFLGNEQRTSDITFWSLGSLQNLEWSAVYITFPVVMLGVVVLPLLGQQLNIMTLGESEAQNLGVNTQRLRVITIVMSALMTGVAVGFAGIISFIGLVVPHVMRLLFGPDHRYTLLGSVLGGAIVLVAADMYGRTLPPPPDTGISLEVPVGVMTALVGGPFFLALILVMQYRRGARV